jgi:hypothetical protein
MYGKSGEKIRRVMGNLFNPVVFSYITGATRAQIYKFIVENKLERDVVAIATDSVCITREVHIDSQELGKFSFVNSAPDTYYLQNGFYRFNGKWKQRGLGKLRGKEIEALEPFEKDGKLYYGFTVNRSRSLVASIVQHRINEIGKIKPMIREVNPNADRKRLWLGKLGAIDSIVCNESVPLSLTYFGKHEI